MKCRSCGNIVTRTFIDLGVSPIANNLLNYENIQNEEPKFPLHIMSCDKCRYVQLKEIISRETIFSKEYLYFSSYSSSWLEHSKVFAEKIITQLNLSEKDLVVEVASNDGYLLQYFHNLNIPVLGIEPAHNVADVARGKGIETINEFFGKDSAIRILKLYRKAKLIIANNVLAHVPDIHDFIEGFSLLLADEGFIIFEFPHLPNLIKFNQFDTIYHEHYSYLSLTALIPVFEYHGLKIVKAERLKTHGGSIRLTVVKIQSEVIIQNSVFKILDMESKYDPLNDHVVAEFQKNVEKVRFRLVKELKNAKDKRLRVAAYGAAAKGNTLLNYAKINYNLIEYVVDLNPSKQGKYLPGSFIPVVSVQALHDYKPDILLILPWNLAEEIKNQLNWLAENGTKFLKAIPEVEYF